MKPSSVATGLISPAVHHATLAVMVIRLLVISSFLAVPSLLSDGTAISFYALIAIGYLATIPYSLWVANQERMKRLIPLQFLVDLCWVTGVVYFTGGASSSLSLLYPLVIISAGVSAGPRRALQMTFLSSAIYVILVLLMAEGILVPYTHPARLASLGMASYNIAFSLMIFACVGAASAFMTFRAERSQQALRAARGMAANLFADLGVPLVLLDRDGLVHRINRQAQSKLGLTEREALGKPFSSFVSNDWTWPPPEQGEQDDACILRRDDGSLFPASVEAAPLGINQTNEFGEFDGASHLLVLHDISSVLQIRREAHRNDSIRNVESLVHIMADGIRNPVAAISCLTQVLRKLDRDGRMDDEARAERARICDQIVRESARLDQVMQRIVEEACFHPEEMDTVMKNLKKEAHGECLPVEMDS